MSEAQNRLESTHLKSVERSFRVGMCNSNALKLFEVVEWSEFQKYFTTYSSGKSTQINVHRDKRVGIENSYNILRNLLPVCFAMSPILAPMSWHYGRWVRFPTRQPWFWIILRAADFVLYYLSHTIWIWLNRCLIELALIIIARITAGNIL